jgi:DNA-binding NarL/FixJ family response regulator
MHISSAHLLSDFLKQPDINYSDICVFLVHSELLDKKFDATLISQVSKSGLIETAGSFGLSHAKISSWNKIIPNTNHPISVTLRSNSTAVVNTLPIWPKDYCLGEDFEAVEKFKTFICLPIYGNNTIFGALSLFSCKKLSISKSETAFYALIANMLNLRISKINGSKIHNNGNLLNPKDILNEREISTFELIKLGKTNGQIAHALGYSESTIRQDTIKIYKKLGITGRQDIHFLKEIN